jgi:hypothetical protein
LPIKHTFVSYINSPIAIIASERRLPVCEMEAGTTAALAVTTATGEPVLVTVALVVTLGATAVWPRTPPTGPVGGATLAGAFLAAAVKASKVLLLLLFLFVCQMAMRMFI